MKMTLSVYYDSLSQPSRSLLIFLRANGVPFEDKPVALRKGEQYGEEFKKINPFSKVPVLDDNGFKLTESITILKYLIRKYDLAEHWYPRRDLKRQARVEEYLDWHHLNTRFTSAALFRALVVAPQISGNQTNPKKVEELRQNVSKVIFQLERYFLKDKKYIAGDEISIADIFAACELTELLACHEQGLYENSPITQAWMERVRTETNPYFDEAHKMIYQFQSKYRKPASKL